MAKSDEAKADDTSFLYTQPPTTVRSKRINTKYFDIYTGSSIFGKADTEA